MPRVDVLSYSNQNTLGQVRDGFMDLITFLVAFLAQDLKFQLTLQLNLIFIEYE